MDVTFDEYFMLQSRKEFVVDTCTSEKASKQIELEREVSDEVQDNTHVELVTMLKVQLQMRICL